jgi:hypothetical protein
LRLHHVSVISQLNIFNNIPTDARYSGPKTNVFMAPRDAFVLSDLKRDVVVEWPEPAVQLFSLLWRVVGQLLCRRDHLLQ